jgi:hypothetical protein
LTKKNVGNPVSLKNYLLHLVAILARLCQGVFGTLVDLPVQLTSLGKPILARVRDLGVHVTVLVMDILKVQETK